MTNLRVALCVFRDPRTSVLAGTFVLALVASACTAGLVDTSPTSRSSLDTTAGPSGPPTATFAPPQSPDSARSSSAGVTALVMGTGRYPTWMVDAPAGWSVVGDHFVVKYATDKPGPVLGVSVWDVGLVFRDPCHWQGQAFDPGPSVDELVSALVAQPMRNASKPTDVTLAGYAGRYLELSVPADMISTKWTEFDDCDVDDEGARDFQGWLGKGMGNRYAQVPGQVDRLWVLDVNGLRLVVDATYSPDTNQVVRDELGHVVESLRLVAP